MDNEINDSCHAICITSTINTKHYDLRSNFMIQSLNVSNHKS
jgi:hypothetical protein